MAQSIEHESQRESLENYQLELNLQDHIIGIAQNCIQNNLSPRSLSIKNTCQCHPRILIVDDNSYNLLPLKFFLKDMHFDYEKIKQIQGISKSNSENSEYILQSQSENSEYMYIS